jgi:hypothetical protein
MNKKYKPKKPIVYDIDRSLLHTASKNILNAIGNDTIIGQPTFHNKPIKVGTEKVQVGTEKVQVGTKKVQIGTKLDQIPWSGELLSGIPSGKGAGYSCFTNNTNRSIIITSSERRMSTGVLQPGQTFGPIYYKNWEKNGAGCYIQDAITGYYLVIRSKATGAVNCDTSNHDHLMNTKKANVRIIDSTWYPVKQNIPLNKNYTYAFEKNIPIYEDQPVYEDRPVYENKPVYKDSPVKGLIMYLRRKGA